MFEDDVQRGAAREFRFRPASQEHGGQSRRRANPRADTKSLHSVGNRPYPSASRGRLRDRTSVLPFTARADHFAFGIHGFFTARIGAAGGDRKITLLNS